MVVDAGKCMTTLSLSNRREISFENNAHAQGYFSAAGNQPLNLTRPRKYSI